MPPNLSITSSSSADFSALNPSIQEGENSQGHGKSSTIYAATRIFQSLNNSLTDMHLGLKQWVGIQPSSGGSSVNIILGQAQGRLPKNLVAQSQAGDSLLSARTEFLALAGASPSITMASPLSQAQRQAIGLLRAPDINESLIRSWDYNLSMANEALVFGANLRTLFTNRITLHFSSLWSACRAWRVGRLDSQRSKPNEIKYFSESRLDACVGPYFTLIHVGDSVKRYEYVLPRLAQMAKKPDTLNLQKYSFKTNKGKERTLLSLQHTITVQGETLPLTEVRTALNGKGAVIPNPWAHAGMLEFEMTDSRITKFFDVRGLDLLEGMILHTSEQHLNVLALELQDKFIEFSQTVRALEGNTWEQASLTRTDLKNPDVKVVVDQLAGIHYLLAQATLDLRGSAAKSELFVRSLAVAAGFELPAFKKGFVPDLEAFMNSRERFIEQYGLAFE